MKKLNILLCNDDGVSAKGIRVLYNALKEHHNVAIVAPLEERSSTGHTLSLQHPLKVHQLDDDIYGCSGFPADCAYWGLGHLFKDKQLDLVVSGINRGANLGQDIYYSGTVAAARESSLHGYPAIAVSSFVDFESMKKTEILYETAAEFITNIVNQGVHEIIGHHNLININVPNCEYADLKGVELAELGLRHYTKDVEERTNSRGQKYYWIGGRYEGHEDEPETDTYFVSRQKISVSLLNLWMKRDDTSSKLRSFLKTSL